MRVRRARPGFGGTGVVGGGGWGPTPSANSRSPLRCGVGEGAGVWELVGRGVCKLNSLETLVLWCVLGRGSKLL